jgi:hypothetical protein
MDKEFCTLTLQANALKTILSSLRAMSYIREAIKRRKSEIDKQLAVLSFLNRC